MFYCLFVGIVCSLNGDAGGSVLISNEKDRDTYFIAIFIVVIIMALILILITTIIILIIVIILIFIILVFVNDHWT